jgi:hypothetical protein
MTNHSPRRTKQLEALHKEERDRIEQDNKRYDFLDTGTYDEAFNGNWMRRTGWTTIFSGVNRMLLVRLAEAPAADGSPLIQVTATSLASTLSSISHHFKLRSSFGHAITDNAFENEACMNLLSAELAIPWGKRHLFCIGHIINPVAQTMLFDDDPEAFEDSLIAVIAEEDVNTTTKLE